MSSPTIVESPPTVATPPRHPGLPKEFASSTDCQTRVRRAQRAAVARQSSGRRRLIDPTTCERDYSPAELEFMKAIQAYKLASGRSFPSWGEVLTVLHGLGYRKADVASV
jgi:hypothetical protein